MKHAVWVLIVSAALAGCSGDDGGTASVPKCDENQYEDAAGECVDHVEPHIMLTGLPSTVEQFRSTSFTWSLNPGTRNTADNTVHSMDSRILAFTNATTLDNATEPPAGGVEIAKQQHKNFPDNFTAAFSWEQVGTVYLKGYMSIDGHVWQDLATVDVTAITATGNATATVTISSPPAAVDDNEVGVTVGNAVTFQNDAPYAYDISFTGDGCPAAASIAADASVDFDFLVPGTCNYVLLSPLGDAHEEYDPGRLTGKVTVSKP